MIYISTASVNLIVFVNIYCLNGLNVRFAVKFTIENDRIPTIIPTG